MFIVTKEIDGENISKLCRTCLREDGEKMVCLFVGPAGSSLAAKLRSLSCLEVWQGDGLPEKMCDRCITRAESALLYREQCRAADRALRQAAVKVSGLMSYTRISGCKKYQQNEALVPIQNSQKTLKCVECGAVFITYDELCAHGRLHLPTLQNRTPVQHMHIVEPRNSYLNPSNLNANLVQNSVDSVQMPSLMRSDLVHPVQVENEESNRAACALHCSLCNHTFTNRTQLISHNFAHNADQADLSSGDNTNIEVSEDSNQMPRNLSYARSIDRDAGTSMENLSFSRRDLETGNKLENLNFHGVNELKEVRAKSNVITNNSMCRSLESLEAVGMSIPENSIFNNVGQRAIGQLNDDCNLANVKSNSNSNDDANSVFKKYTCSVCSKSFQQKSKLLTHQFSHTGQKPFKCSDCNKAYVSKSKLNAHMRLHSKTNVHECSVCAKSFTFLSYLEDHMKTHRSKIENLNGLGEKTFECAVCHKKFRFAKNLRAHVRLHTGKNLLSCEICDKQFSQKYNLKIHLLTHRASKAHKCDYCGKRFNQKGNLTEHLRIHNNLKPYRCEICSKSFAQSSHLKNHVASHDSQRDHACKLCGKKFKLSGHLKRHLDLHSGIKSYKCIQCDQMFSQAFSLKRHLKRHADIHI